LAFGLPGNPVSALVCFELFVRTALRARQSHPRPRPVHVPARLADDVDYRASRLTYHPAQLWSDEESWWVKPVTWHGSPDLRALVSANALVVIPPSSQPLAAGAIQQVLPLPGAP
jgi:molybdopterin molybdotransferase